MPIRIDLKQHRVIRFADRGHQYELEVGNITDTQWEKYFEGIVSTSEVVNGERIDVNDFRTARHELLRAALVDARGYTVRGGTELRELPDWRTKIPVKHVESASKQLVSAERSKEQDAEIVLGEEVVYIDAVWGVGASGAVEKVVGLKHVFNTPSLDQQRRYSRDAGRSVVEGKSRFGKTRWPGMQKTLIALYDELVVAQDGYGYDGHGLVDREEIVRVMDAYHKVAAMDAVFSSVPVQEAEAE